MEFVTSFPLNCHTELLRLEHAILQVKGKLYNRQKIGKLPSLCSTHSLIGGWAMNGSTAVKGNSQLAPPEPVLKLSGGIFYSFRTEARRKLQEGALTFLTSM